jgi:hypothetical protein
LLFKARRPLDLATSSTQGRSSTSPGSPVILNPSSAPLRRPFTLPLLATSGKKSHPTHPTFLSPMHGFSPGPHAPRLSGSLWPACLFISYDSDLLSLDTRAPALLFLRRSSRHLPLRAGPGAAPRTSAPLPWNSPSPRPSTGRPRGRAQDLGLSCYAPPRPALGPDPPADTPCSCCHLQLGPHDSCPQTLLYRHYNRSRLGFVNVELLGPRALGHIEHSCPGDGPLPVSTGLPPALQGGEFPVVIVPILAPGWAGTPHPRSTSTRLGGPD